MIRRRQVDRADKKVHPLIGLLLFAISIVLLLLTAPLGFIYGLCYNLFRAGPKAVGEYLLKIAVSIDQLGNVIMQHLLNDLWMKKGGYKFGNRDETISSALGRNKRLGTLTGFGRVIDKILDMIDPNHSLDSIDYYVEPSQDILDEIAWINTRDRQILCLRYPGAKYHIPTAKRILTDSDGEALFKTIKDTLGAELDISSLRLEEIFQARSESHDEIIRKTCYRASFRGSLDIMGHVTELSWLGYADRDSVPEIDQKIFDYLHQKGELA